MYLTPLLSYFLLSALSLALHSHWRFLALSDYLACLWFWFYWLVVYFAFLRFLGLLWEFFLVLLSWEWRRYWWRGKWCIAKERHGENRQDKVEPRRKEFLWLMDWCGPPLEKMRAFGFGWKWLKAFFFFFFYSSRTIWPSQPFMSPINSYHFFIKNWSHDTIHTFKNYFVTIFSISVKINPI